MGALGSGAAYAEFFRQVETLGLDAVWTEDRIFHAANMLDPLMLLASAAASTRRIELGTAVLVLTLRNDDRSRARDALRGFLHGYYGSRFDVDQSAIFGSPGEVAARLAEHVKAGITRLMLGVPTLDIGHLQRVAVEVAPAVRAAALC